MDKHPPFDSSREGQLLVATPFVDQEPYRHAVVLLMRHSDRGSLGLVLNNDLPAGLAGVEEFVRSGRLGSGRFKSSRHEVSLVLGCVFWPPGQLERELERGIWISTPAQLDATTVRHDLWSGLLRQIGRSVLEDSLQLRGFPSDVRLN